MPHISLLGGVRTASLGHSSSEVVGYDQLSSTCYCNQSSSSNDGRSSLVILLYLVPANVLLYCSAYWTGNWLGLPVPLALCILQLSVYIPLNHPIQIKHLTYWTYQQLWVQNGQSRVSAYFDYSAVLYFRLEWHRAQSTVWSTISWIIFYGTVPYPQIRTVSWVVAVHIWLGVWSLFYVGFFCFTLPEWQITHRRRTVPYNVR